MKPKMFENIVNHERFLCANTKDVREIDGVKYLSVQKVGTDRVVLMRQEALRPVVLKKSS
jgi:hypothetical protein